MPTLPLTKMTWTMGGEDRQSGMERPPPITKGATVAVAAVVGETGEGGREAAMDAGAAVGGDWRV